MNRASLVAANLIRKPARTLLTTASLFVAFLLFGLMEPVAQLFDGSREAADNRLIVAPKHSISDMLPLRYVNEVSAMPGVALVAHWTWFGGTFRDPANQFARWAVPPETFLAITPELVLPPEQAQAFINTRSGAIIGRKTAERYGLAVGDKIPLTADIWHNRDGSSWTFDLVGIYDGLRSDTGTTAMYLNFEYFDEYRIVAPGFISNLLVKTVDPNATTTIAAEIDASFANSPMETRTVSEQQYALQFARQLGDIGLIARGILGAVFFTIVLLTINTMAQSWRERTREVGVLKTLGFPHGHILVLILSEAIIMALAGALPALALAGWLLGQSDSLSGQMPSVRLDLDTALMGLATALGVAVVAGGPPALRALRLNAVDALR